MARYTGPKVKLSRRLSTNLFENEKGRKAMERRPFPPGQHGRTRRRSSNSEYLTQLQEKQKRGEKFCGERDHRLRFHQLLVWCSAQHVAMDLDLLVHLVPRAS